MIFYEEILREFQKQKVKYIIVGGVAVNLLGSMRSTADLDILVEMSNENLTKVVKILKAQGFVVKQPVDPLGIANKEMRRNWIEQKNMKAFNFYKDQEFKEVDIIIESPISYEKARKGMVKVKFAGMSLPVISLDDLVIMKKMAGREIDQSDLVELTRLRKIKRNKS